MTKGEGIFCTHLIAIMDLLVGLILIGVATFQFSQGSSLMRGSASDNQKLIRLVCYATIIYIFLLIHVTMSIQLHRSARKIVDRPIYAIKAFGWWREWSVIYLVAMLLHAIFVLMLMDEGQRKSICLISSLGHATIRPIGIAVVGKLKHNLETNLPIYPQI